MLLNAGFFFDVWLDIFSMAAMADYITISIRLVYHYQPGNWYAI